MSATLAGGARFARPAQATDRWVQRLSVSVLVLTLLFIVFGVPGEDATDTAQTDRVSPLNSWIWLGLLAMAAPVLKARWRDVLALLLGSWALLALYAYFALSVAWALDPGASLRRLLFTLVQLAIFATLLSGLRRAPLVHIVIAAVCATCAFADLLSWIVSPGTAMTDEGLAGLQGQKNQTGLLMMYGCLAAVPCIFIVRSWLWKTALAGAAMMMAGLLVATRSSTSQSVVLSAAVVMPAILAVSQLPRRTIIAVAAVTALAVSIPVLGYLAYCGITGLDITLPLRGATFSARTDIWWFVVDEIKKRPWFGAGYSSLWSIDPAVQPSLKTDQWFGLYAIINEGHDGYLDQWATGGIVGLAGSLFVLFRAIVLAAKALHWTQAQQDGRMLRPTALFHLSILLGLIVHNFTESNLFNNNALLAVAFLIAALDLERWRITVGRRRGLRHDKTGPP